MNEKFMRHHYGASGFVDSHEAYFVSDERFSRGGLDRVIKRSNRATTRKWYDLGRK